jgi:hypothetical protein
MRIVALDLLVALEPWHARLIGSVWSGHARHGSDIDIHVFGDVEAIEADVASRGWQAETREVLIRVPGGFRTFWHVHLLDRPFPVELSVYPYAERRATQRSSVDGKTIDRVSAARLRKRLLDEHAEAWMTYQRDGVLGFEEGEDLPDEFAGLLARVPRA